MIAWIDASGGVAGDMLLGALLDAGADLAVVQHAVDTVLPSSVRLSVRATKRAGIRAVKLHVDVLVADPPHRRWSDIRERIAAADLTEPVREMVLSVFTGLAAAEARVHAVPVDDIHFHEIGAVDSIADIVGVCAAIDDLGVTSILSSAVAVGSGRLRIAHGDMAIPGPAVTELLVGKPILAGGDGELTTPTGAALLTTLADGFAALPAMVLSRIGVGAGTRDDPDRANVTRVLLGERIEPTGPDARETAVLLETNVDDLDPRVWPAVLAALLAAGAADAWLVPIVMKKGRPAHVLSVLTEPSRAAELRAMMLTHTTSFGVRQRAVDKFPAARGWLDIDLDGTRIPVKIAHVAGEIVRATPEFENVAALADQLGRPVVDVLDRVKAAATQAGWEPGTKVPGDLRTTSTPPPEE